MQTNKQTRNIWIDLDDLLTDMNDLTATLEAVNIAHTSGCAEIAPNAFMVPCCELRKAATKATELFEELHDAYHPKGGAAQ